MDALGDDNNILHNAPESTQAGKVKREADEREGHRGEMTTLISFQ